MKSKHGTLTADVVATETITDAAVSDSTTPAVGMTVVVQFVDGTGPIYYTLDGSTPTVAGDDTYAVTAKVPARVHRIQTTSTVTAKLISAAADSYAVEVDD